MSGQFSGKKFPKYIWKRHRYAFGHWYDRYIKINFQITYESFIWEILIELGCSNVKFKINVSWWDYRFIESKIRLNIDKYRHGHFYWLWRILFITVYTWLFMKYQLFEESQFLIWMSLRILADSVLPKVPSGFSTSTS